MKVTKAPFGTLNDGRLAMLFQFKSSNGLQIKISNYGGIITSIKSPDRDGRSEEITAGFPQLGPYLQNHPYFGVLVGRYANRIAQGRFSIEGISYQLPVNNGANHLHGGPGGFHTKLWDYTLQEDENEARLVLRYLSPHLEEGYPGNLAVQVIYSVFDNNRLEIRYEAQTDQPTHVNLTNHAYFNLSGFNETIENHQLQLSADSYLELNANQIPTGKILSCQDTPMDFRKSKKISEQGIPARQELDHCFVLDQQEGLSARPAAILFHEQSGRRMQIYCSQPGIQVYPSNFLDGSLRGHKGIAYLKHSAICLETQHYQDSPNQLHFPSTLLQAGEKYLHTTRYQFDTL